MSRGARPPSLACSKGMPLVVHTLRFASTADLSRAFQLLMDADDLEDCLVEAPDLQLRFVAPEGEADALVERIYLDGGLAWCSRHRLDEEAADQATPPDGDDDRVGDGRSGTA